MVAVLGTVAEAAPTKTTNARIEKTIDKFLKSLGDDFTYPSYDPENNVVEKKLTAEMLTDMLDVDDFKEYLEEAGEKEDLDIYLVGMMDNNLGARLSDRLTNMKGVMSDDIGDTSSSLAAERFIIETILYHTMVIKDQIKDIMRKREWGTDDNGIKKLARNVLLFRECRDLSLFLFLEYWEQATKDIPELKKLFEKLLENNTDTSFKNMYRGKKDENLGFG